MSSRAVQRLVGVVVLAALLVLFLPMVLNLEGTHRVDTRSKIPAKPALEPVQIAEPVRVEGAQTPKSDEQIFQVPDDANVVQNPVAEVPEEPALNDAGVPVAWILQVGSFKEKDKADNLTQQLLAEGYKAYSRVGSSTTGDVYRVYVGPNILKEKLLADMQAIEQRHQIKPLLRRFEP